MQHLYGQAADRIAKIIAALNEIEKMPTDDPSTPYLGGPIPILLDGEPYGRLVNEIGDEWAWESE